MSLHRSRHRLDGERVPLGAGMDFWVFVSRSADCAPATRRGCRPGDHTAACVAGHRRPPALAARARCAPGATCWSCEFDHAGSRQCRTTTPGTVTVGCRCPQRGDRRPHLGLFCCGAGGRGARLASPAPLATARQTGAPRRAGRVAPWSQRRCSNASSASSLTTPTSRLPRWSSTPTSARSPDVTDG